MKIKINAKNDSLRSILESEGFIFPCGGKGLCGRCKIIAPTLPITEKDVTFIQKSDLEHGVRLACDKVIDVCAAPGGKSFLAAIFTGECGCVKSFELHESKLSLIREGAQRLSLGWINVSARDARNPDSELFCTADAVIVDAPCSGLGVIGKKPDLRYKDLSALAELPKLQYEILNSSKHYLKTGGRLVYSTCTLNPEENERITDKFISENPEYCYEDFSVGELSSVDGKLTLYPHIHNTDGFFVAKIRKIK